MAGKAKERVYVIENKSTGSKRLVQAKSEAAALNHVVDDVFDARTVGTVEMGELMGRFQVRLEFAGQVPTPPPSALPSGGDLVDECQKSTEASTDQTFDDVPAEVEVSQ